MNMNVKNALSCRFSNVYSDIKTIGVKSFLNKHFTAVYNQPQSMLLVNGKFKIIGNMPLRDD